MRDMLSGQPPFCHQLMSIERYTNPLLVYGIDSKKQFFGE